MTVEKLNNLKKLTDGLKNAKILLIGDIMLDTFVWGSVARISPEAPIPVIKISKKSHMLGGAGNVLANIQTLGAKTDVITLIGDDHAGLEVKKTMENLKSDTTNLISSPRPTILKTRYIAQNQQLLRVDEEETDAIEQNMADDIAQRAEKAMQNTDVMILSDYGKGLLTPYLIEKLIKLAKNHNIPVIVDPKSKDFSLYKGATIITPNKKELSEAANNAPVQSDGDVEKAAQSLIDNHDIETIIATRSEDGISVVSKNAESLHIPTQALEVYDVSGAGDTVVAVVAATIATGASNEEAAALANVAAGIVVAKVGTATVQPNEMIETIKNQERHNHIAPLLSWDDARAKIAAWQENGLKVGFTNGCFDIIHYGHVNYLAQAKERCDRLVLGLNHDQSVRLLKGPSRPVNDEDGRAAVIGALSSVDLVVLFGAKEESEDNTPTEVLGVLKPDILMKGGDYTVDQLPEAKIVLEYGGTVDIMPLYDGYSTTNIIEKSRKTG